MLLSLRQKCCQSFKKKRRSLSELKGLSSAYRCYLSVAGEGGVVKQEVSTEKHHDGIIYTQDGPVYKDGPLQQRVLRNVSEEKHNIKANGASESC